LLILPCAFAWQNDTTKRESERTATEAPKPDSKKKGKDTEKKGGTPVTQTPAPNPAPTVIPGPPPPQPKGISAGHVDQGGEPMIHSAELARPVSLPDTGSSGGDSKANGLILVGIVLSAAAILLQLLTIMKLRTVRAGGNAEHMGAVRAALRDLRNQANHAAELYQKVAYAANRPAAAPQAPPRPQYEPEYPQQQQQYPQQQYQPEQQRSFSPPQPPRPAQQQQRTSQSSPSRPPSPGRVPSPVHRQAPPTVPVPVPQQPPEPPARGVNIVYDYHHVRTSADRDREIDWFESTYKFTRGSCVNHDDLRNDPSAMLRFQEASRGAFVIVRQGQVTMAFPWFATDLQQDRQFLEGVFQYPQSAGALRVAQPAMLDQRGTELVLTQPGVLEVHHG
jgi:hypothetical protein